MSEGGLSHVDEGTGAVRMVDVGGKAVSRRRAVARASVRMAQATRETLRALPKGDALATAQLAGIMAAKRTGELIPLCHPLGIDAITVDLSPEGTDALRIEASVTVRGRTGVEMEALTAVTVAALTVYDMCKAVDRGMAIERVRLEEKTGGRSGTYRREPAPSGESV